VDVDAEGVEAAATAIAFETGQRAVGLVCDVSDAEAARRAVAEAASLIGPIDLLLNNAGILAAGDILTASLEDFDRVLSVNLRAAFVIGQAVAQVMVASELKGAIINMSSINAVMAIPTQLAYVTSKGAMNQLTRAMALGLAPHGIRVNAIGPGTIATDILKGVMTTPDAARGILSRTPLKRFGEPDEIGKVAVFLASDDASYFTGQTLYPDGGRLALNYTVAVD
jgi:NAD(P)-dependent dehydrogenase (short-subunit alcohol dehydrogenase family)